MKLKQIGGIAAVLLVFFLFGWFTGRNNGRNSVRLQEKASVSGVVPAEDVEKNMTETKPDTIYVPYPVKVEAEAGHKPVAVPGITKVPVETLEPGPQRDEAVNAALADWNMKRSYSGTFFDDKVTGKLSYAFDVQFNRAGQIKYYFEPAPVPVSKQRIRLRPTVAGEYYTNGQYSFGAGVQYGAFGLNVRALSLGGGKGYAFGVGGQIIF